MCVCKQCRQVKITIKGDEGVPVQVDGEAWIQPPGIVQIIHKNRAQMLTRDRVSVCDKLFFFFQKYFFYIVFWSLIEITHIVNLKFHSVNEFVIYLWD